MIVSSMAGTFCLGDFLGTIFAETFAVRFFCVLDLAAFLPAGLTLAFLRFGAFLRVALRFFALAMGVSCEVGRRLTNFEAMQLGQHYPSRIRRATLVDVQLGRSHGFSDVRATPAYPLIADILSQIPASGLPKSPSLANSLWSAGGVRALK
jgi:hypothetical protein